MNQVSQIKTEHGVGRAIELCYAREAANVVISYLSDDSDAEATSLLVEQAGVKAEVPIAGYDPSVSLLGPAKVGALASTPPRPVRFGHGSFPNQCLRKGPETWVLTHCWNDAQPIELAPLYVWLASADASYVTAEVFGCTGGQSQSDNV